MPAHHHQSGAAQTSVAFRQVLAGLLSAPRAALHRQPSRLRLRIGGGLVQLELLLRSVGDDWYRPPDGLLFHLLDGLLRNPLNR